jgi:Protein of unknown function (DUF4054)
MDFSTVTITDFKNRFWRDFNYSAPDDPDYVDDRDITVAFGDAQVAINQGLFGPDSTLIAAYLLLTAHCMCNNLRAASAGIWSPAAMPISSSGMAAASETYGIPQEYLNDPLLATYTQTSYGLKYLSMALPALRGNFGAVLGTTLP